MQENGSVVLFLRAPQAWLQPLSIFAKKPRKSRFGSCDGPILGLNTAKSSLKTTIGPTPRTSENYQGEEGILWAPAAKNRQGPPHPLLYEGSPPRLRGPLATRKARVHIIVAKTYLAGRE